MPEGERFYVADVGTGSGAVALAIAKERPEVRVFATDVSDEALHVAKENATRCELGDRVAVLKGSLLESDSRRSARSTSWCRTRRTSRARDIDALMPDVRDFEPRQALDGGPDGLDVIRALIAAAGRARRGIAIEVGQGQSPAVAELLKAAGFANIATRKDLAGIERVVFGTR